MFGFIHLLFICMLASQTLAFNITVGSANLTTTEMLSIPEGAVKTACNTNCTAASTAIQACNDDPACLCRADTVAALLDCEQCMFTKLVSLNLKMDFRVGSQAVLAGYAASCKEDAKVTLAANQTSLTLPDNWDGPVVAVLPVGGVAVAIITAVFLGVSGITLVSSM